MADERGRNLRAPETEARPPSLGAGGAAVHARDAELTPESPFKQTPLLARPFVAMRYVTEGLAAAARHEAAFRLELIALAVMGPLGFYLGKTGVERALLVGVLLLVLLVELLNSSLEAALDRISLERHPLVKRAKDMAAAAVFLSLVNAGVVWLLVLLG